jgi:LytS/YehU family sensor histidine kinase
MKRQHAYWACQIGGWSLIALFWIVISAFFRDLTWERTAYMIVLGVAGLAFTHGYRLVAKQRDWAHLSLKQLIPRVILAALVLAILTHLTCDLVGRHVLELSFYDEIESEMGVLLGSIQNWWILFMLWSVIYFGVHAAWNYRQAEVDKWKLEAQAETARLKALKLQLNPHFFFNSLNSVRALIAEDPDRAQRMVTRLARLLRNTLQVDDVKTVPLEEELSTVRTYLELESVRFEDRLRYEIDASDEALNRPVPFLLVQTLAENGIKHGIARCQGGGVITVGARVEDDDLCIRVTNPGTLETEEGGTGLANARERLRLLFGEKASLTVQNADPDTVEAEVVLPGRPGTKGPAVREEAQAVLAGRE